jgi:predicted Rossmann fold flavoprotein
MQTFPFVDLAVAGGGAAGFFAALHAKEAAPEARVVILEKSQELLAKVSISGGGRCNVTHHCFDPKELVKHYPRGGRELLGPFHRFQPSDTIEWFESRGVPLKVEDDGRMFPVSDASADIVNALLHEADHLGVKRNLGQGLAAAEKSDEGFLLTLSDGVRLRCRALVIATGGNRASGGWAVAEKLGHHIHLPVPSLFSFHIHDTLIEGLAGITIDPVELQIPAFKAQQRGSMLITHNGLSGPAVLKLSAWQARAFAEHRDEVEIRVNWSGGVAREQVAALFAEQRRDHGARIVWKNPLFFLPRRLWDRLTQKAGIGESTSWARLPAAQEQALIETLIATPLRMKGKTLNKDEFVTCGGVDLAEVDMRTFQSRICPNLWFAGEVLDIDGVTGGFNFQAAWTGGALAGTSAGAFLAQD